MRSDVREVLEGAVDLHVHPGPSPFPRRIGIRQAAEQAAEAGFAAILVKSHHHSMLTDIEAVVSSSGPLPIPVYGGTPLNNFVGGLNVHAVELGINRGSKLVWFPTISSGQHIAHHSDELKFPTSEEALSAGDPIRVIDDAGELVPEAHAVLRLVKDHDLILSTGHMAPVEITAVLTAAVGLGITKLFVQHPEFVIEAETDLVHRWIEMGAVIEHSLCMFDERSGFYEWPIEVLKGMVEEFGPGGTVFGSDLGQRNNPYPVEGYEAVVGGLLDLGVSAEDIRTMVVTNPSRLLGL